MWQINQKTIKMKKLLFFFTILSCLAIVSCGGGDDDDEPKTTYNNVTLACKTTHTIKGDATWTSSNKYIASVAGNVVTAERVGEATISSDKGSFKVTVTPTVSVFSEPYLEWGASKSTVKNFMRGATLYEETSDQLTYKGNGALMLTLYDFENGRLKGSGIALNGDYIDSDALIEQMLQYYVPVTMDEDEYSFYFATPDKKSGVMLSLKSSGRTIIYMIIYVPLTNSDSRSITNEYEELSSAMGIDTTGNPIEKFNELKNIIF